MHTAPDPTAVARWQLVLQEIATDLARMEVEVAKGELREETELPQWNPPTDLPPLPATLLPLAQELQRRQAILDRAIIAQLDHIRREQRMVRQLDQSQPTRPVYLDLDG